MKRRFYTTFYCSSCGERSRVRTDYVKYKKTTMCKECTPPPVGKGSKNPNWKGGRTKNHGYYYIYDPFHPYRTQTGYVLEHRIVMERHIGRTLSPDEVVHHINKITTDNRIENLMLFPNKSAHRTFHEREKHGQ